MGVVILSGLMASTFSLLGLFASVEFTAKEQAPEIAAIVAEILSPSFIVMLYLLLFPLIVFFAGLMIPIAVRAKSFKEAQSIISPLNIVIILPAMVGFFPGCGIERNDSVDPGREHRFGNKRTNRRYFGVALGGHVLWSDGGISS